jgi:hypothetical protein
LVFGICKLGIGFFGFSFWNMINRHWSFFLVLFGFWNIFGFFWFSFGFVGDCNYLVFFWIDIGVCRFLWHSKSEILPLAKWDIFPTNIIGDNLVTSYYRLLAIISHR